MKPVQEMTDAWIEAGNYCEQDIKDLRDANLRMLDAFEKRFSLPEKHFYFISYLFITHGGEQVYVQEVLDIHPLECLAKLSKYAFEDDQAGRWGRWPKILFWHEISEDLYKQMMDERNGWQ